MFDIIRYSDAFDRFLVQMMNQVGQTDHDDPLAELCEILRIGRIEALFYENSAKEMDDEGEEVLCYECEGAADNGAFRVREMSKKGHVAVYSVYPIKGEAEWDDEEKSKIEIIAKMLFNFNARERLIRFAEYALNYDGELKIPNLNYFREKISELIRRHEFFNYGVCFFNLRHFSSINRRIGRKCGTQVMIGFITRLQNELGNDGIVCRVGGDNFITYFKRTKLGFVMDYLHGTAIPYGDSLDEHAAVSATAGYYMLPNNAADDIGEIIERAHIAAQSAKHDPSKLHVFYDEKLQISKENASKVEGLFHDAIDNEEFLVYYQPKVQLKNYRLSGAEALCRWKHDGKLIPPFQFIPVLEQSHSICKLDFYMLEHVCRDIRGWLDNGQKAVRVSVNLSRRHMGDPQLLEKIISIINKYNVPHHLIEIELTETTTDIEFNDLKKIVSGLHQAGIRTSVDDFGVGYSSLNLIRQVPWDVIKIDKSFLPETPDKNSQQYVMFSRLLSMIRDMGLKCIVEGVETVEQVKMLKENRCYFAQGFYFDRPLEKSDFEERLKALS